MSFMEELPVDWREAMKPFMGLCRLSSLEAFVEKEYAEQTVYPPRNQLFRAFYSTPFDSVRVVILGQDPYHEEGQACGLAFAVPPGTKQPASLRNILKEYSDDLGKPLPKDVNLELWGRHGILLLNTVLSVRAGAAASHQKHGWEEFTDAAIRALSAREEPVAFILWGNPAAKKASLIDRSRHIVIQSAHPSPLSAYRGFFGSRPFSRVNELFLQRGLSAPDWSLMP